jgi:hypothetical protein
VFLWIGRKQKIITAPNRAGFVIFVKTVTVPTFQVVGSFARMNTMTKNKKDFIKLKEKGYG